MELPIRDPIIKSYQNISFIQGILLAHDNCKNLIYSNYLILKFNSKGRNKLIFDNCSWEDYRLMGLANMNLYRKSNLYEPFLADFIKERVDQEQYILLYSVDEYYLPYSKHYNKDHFVHDSYIYGYEKDYFYLFVYSNGKYEKIKLHQKYIIDSFFSEKISGDSSFSTFSINKLFKFNYNFDEVISTLYTYMGYSPLIKNQDIMSLYTGICDYIAMVEKNDADGELDLRIFRVIMEHKRILALTIIREEIISTNVKRLFCDIKIDSELIFRLALKYNVKRDKCILKTIRTKLLRMMDCEKYAIDKVLMYQ